VDANFNALEDFAESIAAHIYPEEAGRRASDRYWPYNDTRRGYSYSSFGETPRGSFVSALMVTNLQVRTIQVFSLPLVLRAP